MLDSLVAPTGPVLLARLLCGESIDDADVPILA